MRGLLLFGALFLAAASPATAQIQISTQTERTDFLLYERVDVHITLTNVGGTDLILDNNEGRPWLSFLVSTRERGSDYPIRQERQGNPAALTLKAGETKTLNLNITPLFAFRQEGQYRVSAVVDLPGAGEIISDPTPFTVLNGHTVWSQAHSVGSSVRTFSLVSFSPTVDRTQLYLRVQDPAANLVYANIALGGLVASVDPEAYFDPAGNLHILQPEALSTYLYTRVDTDGKILHQSVFKSAPTPSSGMDLVPPRLVKLDDGNVVVFGGLEENMNTPRERLSDGQGKKPQPGGATTDYTALPDSTQ